MKKIYLIDVSNLFFRSFYAIRQLNNSKGMPTNAIYGFLTSITKILKEHKPDYMAFCYDAPGDGFREEIYSDYKGTRSETPDDLVKQFPYIPILAQALNIEGFEKTGFEADDIIGTLATRAKSKGQEVTIVSSDKDFGQLVEPGVRLYDPAKEMFLGSDEIRAKFGVDPSQVIDYLALVGDSSDNVPGVRGVGPKAAQKLLGEFKTLDNIYKNVNDIKNDRLRELMTTQKDQALMSKKLVTIVTDMPIEYREEKIKVRGPKTELLVPLLQELEFKTLLQRLLGEAGGETVPKGPSIADVAAKMGAPVMPVKAVKKTFFAQSTVDSADQIEKALSKELKPGAEIWIEAGQAGLAISMGTQVFKYEGNNSDINKWLTKTIKENRLKLSGFDVKNLAHEFDVDPKVFTEVGHDVLLQAYCLGHEGELDFAGLVKIHLDETFPELLGPDERLGIIRNLSAELESKGESSRKILSTIEYPLVPVLYRMERTGVLVDKESLEKYSLEIKIQIKELEKEIFKLAEGEFNVGSPKQLGQILFAKLKLPVIRKIKTGFSTDSDVLEKLKSMHPIANKILDWRELTKLNSTYVEALPQLIKDKTGRIHTSYKQAVASTGRLSSMHPNLQNIPIRTPRGSRIRNSFIAEKGNIILSADYSQVELRILAHITGDKALTKAFEEDLDIHTATASQIFGVKLEEVTSDHRRTAKAINFGIVYGMSEFGLAEGLQVDRKVAADFIKKYFARYPGVQKYMQEIVQRGTENGYVETMFGRRRYYPGLKSSNRNIKQAAERAAINMPIQGAAADIIKLAMIKIDQELQTAFPDSKMIMQVHDELVFEVKKEKAEALKTRVQKWMGETTKLNVPLKVDVEYGPHW